MVFLEIGFLTCILWFRSVFLFNAVKKSITVRIQPLTEPLSPCSVPQHSLTTSSRQSRAPAAELMLMKNMGKHCISGESQWDQSQLGNQIYR